jgi:hypothetical protein
MNRTDFSIINGFPLNQASLERLQTAFSLFNAFGSIVGNQSIVSGCILNGSSVSDGTVFINSELFEFRGGLAQTKVIIKEDITNLIYKNGNSYPAVKTRYVTFGTGSGALNWSDFKKGYETKSIHALVDRITALEERPEVGNIPVGLIALWDRPANEIPEGWEEHLAMTGKVAIGFDATDSDFDVVGKTGGTKTKKLSIANLPLHFFSYLKAITGRGYRTAADDTPLGGTEPANTNSIGGDEPFSIMNPFRVVHFIKYIG